MKLFDEQDRSERLKISKMLFRTKMDEETSPVQHTLKMNGYIEKPRQLRFVMDHELSIALILTSLPNSFS